MKKILLLSLLFLPFLAFSQEYVRTSGLTEANPILLNNNANRRVIWFNSTTGTYPAKSVGEKTEYRGHINPAELSLANYNAGDTWVFDITLPAKTVTWRPDLVSWATVSAGQPTNTRYVIQSNGGVATEYRDVNIGLLSLEGAQFFGETGTNGQNLVTLNGSVLIPTVNWAFVGGYYEATATAITNQNILASTESATAYYDASKATTAYNQIETLYVDNVPLVPQTSKANVLTNNDFFWDGAKVYVLFNPSGKKMEFTKYDTFLYASLWAGGNSTSSNASSNVVVSNLNITKYGGNSLVSPIGGRQMLYAAAKAYPAGTSTTWGWVVQNVNSYLNRGAGIFLFPKGTVRNCKSYQNGANGVVGNNNSADTYLPNVSGYLQNNAIYQNNWAGYTNSGGNSTAAGVKITRQRNVKSNGNHIYENGNSLQGNFPTDGLWFDVNCVNAEAKRNRIVANRGVGITYEICDIFLCENNFVHSNLGDWQILVSTSSNCIIRNNTVYANFPAETASPTGGQMTKRLVGIVHSSTRSPYISINETVENNRFYMGLENSDVGIKSLVNEYWWQGSTFTPVAATQAQLASYMITNNIIFRNNQYFVRTADNDLRHFLIWTNGTIGRSTLATMQGLGIETGSTISNF